MKEISIKKNIVLNITYTVFNIIFPLITFPYVSRVLNVENMGLTSFFSTVANYAIMISSLGITTYGIKATARCRDNKKELSSVTQELFILNLIMTFLVVFILFFSILFIDKFKNNILLFSINMLYVLASPFSLNWLYSGLEQYSYITKRTIFIKTLSLLLIFIFVRQENDFIIYALITVLSYVVSYLINFFYSRKFLSFKIENKLNIKRHLKSTLVIFASILAINVYTQLDTIMLNFISGDREVGLYTVAVYVKTALLTLVNSISIVLLPRISFYYSNNKKILAENIIIKCSSLIALISISLTIFFIINARDSILVLSGPNYLDATISMQLIMPILIFSGISNITGNQVLIPFGKENYFMKAVIIGAIIDLVLNAVLMPMYGCVGAAMATMLAEFTQMSIQMYYAKKIISNFFDKKSLCKILIAAFLSSFLMICLKHIIDITPFINLVVFGCIFYMFYFFSLLLLKEKTTLELINILKNKIVFILIS